MSDRKAGSHLGGFVSMLVGAVVLSATLIVMNRKVHKPDEARANLIAEVKVEKKKKPPPPKQAPKPKPKPRRTRRSNAPRPNLASNLTALGGGIPTFQGDVMEGFGDDIGSSGAFEDDVGHTEDSVDRMPQPRPGNSAPGYPPRARAKGIEGRVVLSFTVTADGRVTNATVYEAEPEGQGFEEAALAAARSWSFEPALYNGQPVALPTKQTLEFKLN